MEDTSMMTAEATAKKPVKTLFELQAEVERYPFDQASRLSLLERLFATQNENFGAELKKAALFVPDRKVLFYMIEGDKYRLVPEKTKQKAYAPEPTASENNSEDRTATLIDSFLEKNPDNQPKRRLTLTDAASDYAAYLEQQEEGTLQTPTISDAVEKTPQTSAKKTVGEIKKQEIPLPEPEENPQPTAINESGSKYFTETLAKIYIKQGKYEEAVEIMRKLSADNPKKSCYFADQIRFLEKVVINSKSKK